MIIIGWLKNLTVLTIDDQNQGYFYYIQKYLVKGFKYFKENGGSLKKFKLWNCQGFYDDKLMACLRECPDLESLHFAKC